MYVTEERYISVGSFTLRFEELVNFYTRVKTPCVQDSLDYTSLLHKILGYLLSLRK